MERNLKAKTVAEMEALWFGSDDPRPSIRQIRRDFLEKFLDEFIRQAGLVKRVMP